MRRVTERARGVGQRQMNSLAGASPLAVGGKRTTRRIGRRIHSNRERGPSGGHCVKPLLGLTIRLETLTGSKSDKTS